MRAAAVLGPGIKPSALEHFRFPGIQLEIFSSEPQEQLDALLIFGGDGTLHHQLPFLAASKTPVLIVPTGSGNDFARGVGIRSKEDALRLWRGFCADEAQVKEIDLGVIRAAFGTSAAPTEKYFCNVAGVGLDAAANRMANSFPRWLRGHGGYLLAAMMAIISERPEKMKVLTMPEDGQWKTFADEKATLVSVANGSSYGGGIRIAPQARWDDGNLDVCFVRAAGFLRLLRLFWSVLRAEHASLPEVKFVRANRVRIETETPKEVYADGEYIGRTPAEFSVLVRGLKVIVP